MHKSFMTFLLFISVSASAAQFTWIVPNTAGSASDAVVRAIGDEYNRQTGNSLVIEYVPGGDQIIGVNRFKTERGTALILGSSTMHVLNPIFREDLPYTNQDFNHVAWIGWTPNVYYVRQDSPIKTMEDLIRLFKDKRNVSVGVDVLNTQLNVRALKKKYGDQNIQMVPYKGSSQTLMDVLGGHVDLAIGSVSPNIVQNAESGKIRILATTHDKSLTVAGQPVPSAKPMFQIPQINAFLVINRTLHDTPESRKLSKDILQVLQSPSVKSKLSAINLEVEAKDGVYVKQVIDEMTVVVKDVMK